MTKPPTQPSQFSFCNESFILWTKWKIVKVIYEPIIIFLGLVYINLIIPFGLLLPLLQLVFFLIRFDSLWDNFDINLFLVGTLDGWNKKKGWIEIETIRPVSFVQKANDAKSYTLIVLGSTVLAFVVRVESNYWSGVRTCLCKLEFRSVFAVLYRGS